MTARRDAVERPVDRARNRSAVRRRRLIAGGLLGAAAIAVALTVVLASGGTPAHLSNHVTTKAGAAAARPVPNRRRASSFAVGLRTLRLIDTSRTITLPDGATEPRTLITYVRYPALGSTGRTDVLGAPAARADGPFPLIVFGHGFDVTPDLYRRLLQSWARAGYVVAAPVFPLESPDAPGGPDESDLSNQPLDMRFVITQLLHDAAGAGPLSGLIDSAHIAVAGQSDGGDTALAVAYDPRFRDARVGAAAILSGAEIPGLGPFTFPPGGPPLLATQGTADTINPPGATTEFFDAARRPKYLLRLLGAEHLPPYSTQQPQLEIVERVSIAFFDAYLKHGSGDLRRLALAGSVPDVATVLAEP